MELICPHIATEVSR